MILRKLVRRLPATDIKTMRASWPRLAAVAVPLTLLGLVGPAQATLIGNWNFDDGAAGDSSGNGNNGVLDGTASIVNDPARGSVLALDGSGRVDLGNPASLQISGEITVAAWVKADAYASGQNNILNKGHDDNSASNVYPRREFTLRAEGDGAEYAVGSWESGRTPDSNNHAKAANPGDLGRWVHVAGAAVYDAGSDTYTWHLYRNGSEVGTFGPAADGMFDVNYGWAIGARGGPVSVQRGFVGLIDDVRIYDTALSQAEIRSFAPEPTGVALAALAVGLGACGRNRRSARG